METSTKACVRLHSEDNVVVITTSLSAATSLDEENIVLCDDIPRGHKVSTKNIATGEGIIKYGQLIAYAAKPIKAGEHVHSHNAEMAIFRRDHAIATEIKPENSIPLDTATFKGYVRKDGRVGTRNYIGVISTVNCSATVVTRIVEEINYSGVLNEFPNVDGIVPITHGAGCCVNNLGEGFLALQRVMRGYIKHANFAGMLLVGLGCEVNQINTLLKEDKSDVLLRHVSIQDEGGTRNTINKGVRYVLDMLAEANTAQRHRVSVEHLTVALQCGGSDGYSGITANPALGYAVDMLTAHGGSAILSETPEIYGAEHLLTRRAVTRGVGEKLLERIAWWESYASRNGSEMNNNPTPGNKAGGLTTILEKSLGAVAKGGTGNLVGVYEYAEPITTQGLNFMDSPGYDPASITGQVASGANIICFTTGRGSAYGNKPVPSLKLATNTPLFNNMSEDMDVNCGEIITGEQTVESLGKMIFELMLQVASGEKTKSEILGFGDCEFVPWQIGAQM